MSLPHNKQVNPTKHTDSLLFQSTTQRTMKRLLLIILFAFQPENLFTFVEINPSEYSKTVQLVSILQQILIGEGQTNT